MGPESADVRLALRRLVWWCALYADFDRQRGHVGWTPGTVDIPPYSWCAARKVEDVPERRSIQRDVELDAAEERARGGSAAVAAPAPGPAVHAAAAADAVGVAPGLLLVVVLLQFAQ